MSTDITWETALCPIGAMSISSPCREVPIRPLIDDLEFISNKRHWGAAFRFGLREIPETDFQLIAIRMLGQSVV